MLFHTLDGPGTEAYLEQFTCVLDGVRDSGALARAWQRVVERSDALRSSVAWEAVGSTGAGRPPRGGAAAGGG